MDARQPLRAAGTYARAGMHATGISKLLSKKFVDVALERLGDPEFYASAMASSEAPGVLHRLREIAVAKGIEKAKRHINSFEPEAASCSLRLALALVASKAEQLQLLEAPEFIDHLIEKLIAYGEHCEAGKRLIECERFSEAADQLKIAEADLVKGSPEQVLSLRQGRAL